MACGPRHSARFSGLALLVAVQAQAVPQAAVTPEIRGHVLDAAGAPLAGATVRALASDLSVLASARDPHTWRPPAIVKTAADGSFVVAGLTGKRYTVRVEEPGHAPRTSADIAPGAVLDLQLAHGHTLAGRVVDARSREGIAGAQVLACDPAAWTFGEEACLRTRTDEAGAFRFEHAPPGAVTVEAWGAAHARRAAAPLTLPLAEGGGTTAPAGITLQLRPGGRLAGRATDARGRPLADVRIDLEPDQRTLGPAPWPYLRPAHSDADGKFAFAGVAAGAKYVVHGLKHGWPAVEVGPVAIAPGSDIADVRLRLTEGARFTVQLVDPAGKAVQPRIEILLRAGNGLARGVPQDAIRLGEEGRYTVENLRAGRYTVQILPDGWVATGKDEVLLRSGETTDLGTFTLDRGRVISGTVSDPSGQPIAGGTVAASGSYRSGLPQSAETDEQGRYEIAGLPQETVRLEAAAPGHASALREAVQSGEATVDFVLEPTGSIEGRVLGADGDPPAVFRVEARPASMDEVRQRPTPRMHQLDAEGAYRIDGLPAGAYTIEAGADGFAPGRKSGVEVESGRTTDAGTIRLSDGLTLSGRVVAARDGSPVEGARVEAASGENALLGGAPERARTTTDSRGAFVIESLLPGLVTVHTEHPDYAPAQARVDVQAGKQPDALVVQLVQGGTLSGSVHDAAGLPVSGALIVVSAGLLDKDTAFGKTGPDGRYEVPRLAAGSYRVARMLEDGSPADMAVKPAVIEEGEVTIVDFDASPRITVRGIVLRGGQALTGVTLILAPATGPADLGGVRTAETDARGGYQIGLDRPGAYRAIVQTDSTMSTTTIAVPDQADVHLDIAFGGGGIAGSVTDPDGRPIAGAFVRALRVDTPREGLPVPAATRTDAEGRYTMEGVEVGTYDLTASAPGFQLRILRAVVVGDTASSGIDFALQRGQLVRGRVVDPQGRGVPGALIVATPVELAGASLAAVPTETDSNGEFRLTGAAAGPLDLTAITAEWAPAHLSGVVPTDDPDAPGVIVPVTAGGRLRVQLADRDGQPRAGIGVAVTAVSPIGGSELLSLLRPPQLTDAAGVCVIDRLAPGTYAVQAARAAARVEVREGAETAVALRVP